jgi:hypothetical protein
MSVRLMRAYIKKVNDWCFDETHYYRDMFFTSLLCFVLLFGSMMLAIVLEGVLQLAVLAD